MSQNRAAMVWYKCPRGSLVTDPLPGTFTSRWEETGEPTDDGLLCVLILQTRFWVCSVHQSVSCARSHKWFPVSLAQNVTCWSQANLTLMLTRSQEAIDWTECVNQVPAFLIVPGSLVPLQHTHHHRHRRHGYHQRSGLIRGEIIFFCCVLTIVRVWYKQKKIY